MFRILLALIAVGSAINLPTAAGEIIIQEGDSLSGIAKKYQINLDNLIRINGIRDSNNVYPGQKLILPNDNPQTKTANKGSHLVARGDTLGEIAERYKVTQIELIELNKLNSPNDLYIGQILKISKQTSTLTAESKIKESNNYHIIKPGDNLSAISKIYNVPINTLSKINNLSNPNSLVVGKKLFIKKDMVSKALKPSDWRNYGPIKIDWSKWQSVNGSYVAPSIHTSGNSLYLAINCPFRKINATAKDGTWRTWISPVDNFEHNLINDLCLTEST